MATTLIAITLFGHSSSAQPAKSTVLQRIRQLIGLNRAIAAGGSRSSAALSVCVISPLTEINAQGQAQATVPVASPTIWVTGSLNEVRIDREGGQQWNQRASSTSPIQGPINWPVTPIRPGEEVNLLLRPRGASGGDFARIRLTGGNETEMRANEALLSKLGREPKAWLDAVNTALNRNQPALAWALLFAQNSPKSEGLNSLRQEILRGGCRR